MPIVAGSGTARGRRGAKPRIGVTSARPSAVAAMDFLEGDEIAVRILHNEPARAPMRGLGLRHHVGALGNRLETLVDVVDVEVRGGPPTGSAVRIMLLGQHDLHPTAGKDRAAAPLRIAPFLAHRPAEHVAVELHRRVEIRRADEEVMETIDAHARPLVPASYSCASTTASAVMLMMRRTVALGVRMCTGRAAPRSIGPTVMPAPPTTFSMLNAMLAASSDGMTSRFASPFSFEF